MWQHWVKKYPHLSSIFFPFFSFFLRNRHEILLTRFWKVGTFSSQPYCSSLMRARGKRMTQTVSSCWWKEGAGDGIYLSQASHGLKSQEIKWWLSRQPQRHIKIATLFFSIFYLKFHLDPNLLNQQHLLVNVPALTSWMIQNFVKGPLICTFYLWRWGNPVLLTCLWISCSFAWTTFQKMLCKTLGPLWCHKGLWYFSDGSTRLVIVSCFHPLCYYPLSKVWKVQQRISFRGKLKTFCKQKCKNIVFWRSGEISLG